MAYLLYKLARAGSDERRRRHEEVAHRVALTVLELVRESDSRVDIFLKFHNSHPEPVRYSPDGLDVVVAGVPVQFGETQVLNAGGVILGGHTVTFVVANALIVPDPDVRRAEIGFTLSYGRPREGFEWRERATYIFDIPGGLQTGNPFGVTYWTKGEPSIDDLKPLNY